MKRKDSLLLLVIILMMSFLPISILFSVRESLYHNYLLTKKDSRLILWNLFNEYKKSNPEQITIFCGLYTRTHLIDAGISSENIYVRTDEISDYKSIDVYIFDSFSHDKYIYDELENRTLISSGNYSDFICYKINVYGNKTKESIPYSPESLYSPALPDLFYRSRPGPYVELYIKRSNQMHPLIELLEESNEVERCEERYYSKMFLYS